MKQRKKSLHEDAESYEDMISDQLIEISYLKKKGLEQTYQSSDQVEVVL